MKFLSTTDELSDFHKSRGVFKGAVRSHVTLFICISFEFSESIF